MADYPLLAMKIEESGRLVGVHVLIFSDSSNLLLSPSVPLFDTFVSDLRPLLFGCIIKRCLIYRWAVCQRQKAQSKLKVVLVLVTLI